MQARLIAAAIIAAVCALLPCASSAQKTKSQLSTEIGTTYPDNTTGQITPAGVRSYETDVINSIMPTAPVVSGNLACFNGTTGLLQDCGVAPNVLTLGTTSITGGSSGNVLYDNAGKLGEYTQIPVAQGGTGAGTQSGAAANIFPTPTRAGDIAWWNGSAWVTLAGNNSGTVNLQENGSGVPSWSPTVGAGVTSFNSLTGAISVPGTTKIAHVCPGTGNDSNDGLTWQTCKLTLQAGENVANPNGIVYVAAGTETLTSDYNKQPGVWTICASGTFITQGAGQNLTAPIDFNANTANGARMSNCTVDGNRLNNTLGGGVYLVNIGNANGVILDYNTIQNSPGMGVKVAAGNDWTILNNQFSTNYYSGIYAYTGTVNTVTYGIISNNRFTNTGGHGIITDATDFVDVNHNLIQGTLLTGLTLNVTGLSSHTGTVTITAGGTPFSNTCSSVTICPGMFVVMTGGGSGYQEGFITSITSSTVATANNLNANVTGASAIGGSGDLIDVARLSHSKFKDNTLRLSAGGGIVISDEGDSADLGAVLANRFDGNHVENIGGYCYTIQQASSSDVTEDLAFNGNTALNCLDGGVGIYTAGFGATPGAFTITGSGGYPTFITIDNQSTYDIGLNTTPYWLAVGAGTGAVFLGSNTRVNMQNGSVNGGTTVTLSSGWGSTASVSAINNNGNSVAFTITASGTGQAANAEFTISGSVIGKTAPPLATCKNVGTSSAILTLYGENNSTFQNVVAFAIAAPAAGATYEIVCQTP